MSTALSHRLRQPAGAPEGALVLLHGRGADEHDLFPLLDLLDPERRLVGATPRAPLALPPGGAHWYVLGELGYPHPETFLASVDLLRAWFESFAAETGVPFERTVLGGFSQGAVMTHALSLAANAPRPAAAVALSGFIPTVPGYRLDLSTPPPYAIGHGTFDPIIGVEWGRRARSALEAAGADVIYREAPLPHAVDPTFVSELAEWIREIVPRTAPRPAGPGR